MKRNELEQKAKQHITDTYPEHNWSNENKGLIKIMCDFTEKQANKTKMSSERVVCAQGFMRPLKFCIKCRLKKECNF